MNKESPFILNGKIYYNGTVVKIKKEYIKYVGYNTVLKFAGYIIQEKMYCFSPMQNQFEIYKIPGEQIYNYIEEVLSEGTIKKVYKRVDPKYVEGIVSAWIWYILIMFFAVFLKNIGDIITVWLLTTFIFFSWRHRKIKGG